MAKQTLLLDTGKFHRTIHVDQTGRYERLVPIKRLVVIDGNKYTPAVLKAKNVARYKPKLVGIKLPVMKKKPFSLNIRK